MDGLCGQRCKHNYQTHRFNALHHGLILVKSRVSESVKGRFTRLVHTSNKKMKRSCYMTKVEDSLELCNSFFGLNYFISMASKSNIKWIIY
jgi:hypothetical protein